MLARSRAHLQPLTLSSLPLLPVWSGLRVGGQLEMPIRIETFDANLLKLIQSAMGHNVHGSGDRRDK